MESGKISFGFLLLLLLIFGLAAGAGWLAFSNTKTGMPVIDDNIAKIQSFLPQTADMAAAPEDDMQADPMQDQVGDHGHAHGTPGKHDHSHDTQDTTPSAFNLPGTEGQVFEKPLSPVLGLRSVGDPNAPIQIREFFSLTCNHCAAFHEGTYQQLKSQYIDTGKVHFIFEEFPLNGPALYGSMIARCMPEDRYESFISLLLKNQDEWAFGGDFKSALKQNAALAGMGDDDFETCFNNKDLQAAIARNIQLSSDIWKISSTPTFVVNNGKRVLSGVRSLEDFEKIMAFLNAEKAPDNVVSPAPAAIVPAPAPVDPAAAPQAQTPPLDDTSIDINELYEP